MTDDRRLATTSRTSVYRRLSGESGPRDEKLQELERLAADCVVTKQVTIKRHSPPKTTPLKSKMMPR